MMKQIILFLCILVITFSISSCQAIGDIFKAGVWVGIIVVVGVIALIIFLIKGRSKS
jgi:hypothetical protein